MNVHAPSMVRALGASLAVAVVACGSSGSSGSNGSGEAGSAAGADSGDDASTIGPGVGFEAGTPCDASGIADAGRRCSLAMPVQGGLAGTLNGDVGCGDGTGTMGAYLAFTS